MPVLDATAISVSVLRGDFNIAGSVMFLLGIGELLEEWTHKKSVGDLARSMSVQVKKVWLKRGEQEILVPSSKVLPGDTVVIYMGMVIPFDGEVSAGEGMVNQASLTGEALPVRRTEGQSVFAGTVLEEGELEIVVRAVSGSTRFEKIAAMIEESEKLKSGLESKAEHLADRLVPYTLLGTGAVCSFRSYGRFFLCSEAGYANCRTFCNPAGRAGRTDGKGRQISGSGGRGGYDCI